MKKNATIICTVTNKIGKLYKNPFQTRLGIHAFGVTFPAPLIDFFVFLCYAYPIWILEMYLLPESAGNVSLHYGNNVDFDSCFRLLIHG